MRNTGRHPQAARAAVAFLGVVLLIVEATFAPTNEVNATAPMVGIYSLLAGSPV
jgi:hypothetical protein